MAYSIDPISANCYPGTAVLINKFERYIQTIPFSNVHYSINVYADYQTVREHFCSYWKRELGLTYTDTIELGKIFDHALTIMPQFPDNSNDLNKSV